jgi:signal peptidase II
MGLFPFLCIAAAVAFADQATKAIVVSHLHLYQSIELIPRILAITHIHNSGIAFGLFPGIPDVFMVVTLFSMLIVLYFYLTTRGRSLLLSVGCALILGGAMGNLLDRARLGYVVDFIDFSFWPAFNVADSGVSMGVALLLIVLLREQKGSAEDASDTV